MPDHTQPQTLFDIAVKRFADATLAEAKAQRDRKEAQRALDDARQRCESAITARTAAYNAMCDAAEKEANPCPTVIQKSTS